MYCGRLMDNCKIAATRFIIVVTLLSVPNICKRNFSCLCKDCQNVQWGPNLDTFKKMQWQ